MSLAGAVQLSVHAAVAPFAEHSGVAAGQLAPQAPQFCESRRFVSHPSSGREVQCANPRAHAVAGTEQIPAWHSTPAAPGVTFTRPVQSCPQVPQFLGSLGEPHTDASPDGSVPLPLPEGFDEASMFPPPSLAPVAPPLPTWSPPAVLGGAAGPSIDEASWVSTARLVGRSCLHPTSSAAITQPTPTIAIRACLFMIPPVVPCSFHPPPKSRSRPGLPSTPPADFLPLYIPPGAAGHLRQ
jgi:hypothetical protein